MSKLFVFTTGHEPQNHTLLQKSLERVGIKLHLYGEGKNWRDIDAQDNQTVERKFKEGKAYLESVDLSGYSHILFVDSSDTLVLDNEEKIIHNFYDACKYYPISFVVSSEKNYFPKLELEAKMQDRFGPSSYCFVNAGVFMGEKRSFLHNLDVLLERANQFHFEDQDLMMRALLEGLLPATTLDTNCDFAQSFYLCGPEEVVLRDGRLYNTVTKTYPAIAHWNGRVPGREQFWDLFTGKINAEEMNKFWSRENEKDNSK